MKRLMFLFSLLLFVACDNEEDSLFKSPIDSMILISAEETSSTGEIILNCRTEKEYECSNRKITTVKRTGQSSIEISFEAIQGDNYCATAIGPATIKINMGVLAIGEYDLMLKTRDAENIGRLKVTPSQLIFEFDALEGIDILTPIVQR